MTELSISAVDETRVTAAVDLLHLFFGESGFAGDRSSISGNLRDMLADQHHWAAIAHRDGRAVGVVTVTTMLYVEWGRLGEIGDLYVARDARRRGVARQLIRAALAWCADHGCSAVSVVVTKEAERDEGRDEGLGLFHERLGFAATGRRIYTKRLAD